MSPTTSDAAAIAAYLAYVSVGDSKPAQGAVGAAHQGHKHTALKHQVRYLLRISIFTRKAAIPSLPWAHSHLLQRNVFLLCIQQCLRFPMPSSVCLQDPPVTILTAGSPLSSNLSNASEMESISSMRLQEWTIHVVAAVWLSAAV